MLKSPRKQDPSTDRDSGVILAILCGSLAYTSGYAVFNYFQTYIDKKPFAVLVLYGVFLLFLLVVRRSIGSLTLLLLLFTGVLTSMAALALLLGTASNMHFYFLPIVLGAPFLFRGYRVVTVLGTLIPLLLFVTFHLGNISGLSLLQKDFFLVNRAISSMNVIGAATFLAPELISLALYINNLIRKVTASEGEARQLLSNLVPESIVGRYKQQDNFYAEQKEHAVVLFVDIVNFTDLCMKWEASQVVTMLHKIFSEMDSIASNHSIEKIKTIGDCYMAAANVLDYEPAAVPNCARFALKVQEYSKTLGGDIRFRIGMARGKLIAGAIGKKRIFFDVWGNAVNLAARLQHGAEAGAILCSEDFAQSAKDSCVFGPGFDVAAKGLGMVHAYPLLSMK